MSWQLFGPLDLGTLEPLVAAGGVVAPLSRLALAAFVDACFRESDASTLGAP
jgi:hypothetical protein